MPHKRLLLDTAARERILRGATALADAVRVTLGPRSKCIVLERRWGKPLICNDGVTIAKEVDLEDPEENLGAQVLREAAERTSEAVGDGTTTATLLAHAMFADGVRNVAAGASPQSLKRGIEAAVTAAVASIKGQAKEIDDKSEIAQVASISAAERGRRLRPR